MSAKLRTPLIDVESTPAAAPLAILVICALLVLMQLYLAIPLSPILSEDLAAGDAAVALGTVYSLAYGLGFVIFGPLSDRFGRKAVLVPGMAALAVATAALSLAPSVGVVAGLRAAQGLLASSFAAVALAYVGEALPRRWRSTGVGAVATAFLVAGIVGQVYAQVVAHALGWRWVFGLAAPAFALCAIGLHVVLIQPPLDRPPARLAQRYRELAALARQPRLGLVYAASCTVLLSFVAMYATLGPLLQTRFGLDHGEVLLVRLAGLPGMVLSPLAGWLVGRFGATRVSVMGFVVAAASLFFEAVTAASLWSLVLGSAVFVAGIAAVVPAMITLIASRAGPARGGALGLSGLALFIGASVGPLAPDLPIGFSGLLVCLASLLLLGAALITLSSRGGEGSMPCAP
ncbi:MFS transporter [Microlunatus panaciterrae]|uniref:MFS family arabinose efflux permease n=1 Tax=Microlunatus panaciterrae TaxID=400768 RepID=A0ABS2RG50_9ACTN|nr:MFS transporter [Microlunatus panaciterrae]MBM7797723.1 putative MFS family arabinose efflux permease [Microlunatus panaciterrae]